MRLKDLPLRVTALTSAVLLVVPAALVLLVPRRLASGLDRLMPDAALLQSFAARPAQPPPVLWQQRLGPADAQRHWKAQRRLWWQFWGPHGDAGAYLVFSAPPTEPLPADGLRVDDLIVVAPSPLARQLLQEQLKLRRRPPKGLDLRCSQALLQQEAVHWNPAALAQMLGPLAPLAMTLQQGCLSLRSESASLLWQGEAEASPDAHAAAPDRLGVPSLPLYPSAAQPLELRGKRLDLLLRGLLSTALLRTALAERYGLGAEQLRRLQAAPFSLRLQAQPKGVYRAGLQLLVRLPGERKLWERWLLDLSTALEQQGLTRLKPQPALSLWNREDGAVVGGWRWLAADQLLLFLGPNPVQAPTLQAPAEGDWQLVVQPKTLEALQLLPPGLPVVVKRASQLVLLGRGSGSTALAGRLELR
ncbi:MAG: hypothetical protein KXJ50_10750 [Vulcanococcus sp.]|uniref:hypothetical protein n=1 Tax=Vulcanococcus sp. TaxID=2856995 RepID=UPI0025D37CCA|nr:hypothetical protein [Vulcanococcus sp.]MBW0172813.1 hypothetical protein [Vulcanococcus sp.]MBW0181535.1 hypothetical protein [Vulcanococcus sp.]